MGNIIEKTCDICGTDFTTNKRSNKRCGSECSRIGKNRSSVKAVTRRRQEVAKTVRLFLGSECVICGYNRCNRALDAHHVDPELKTFTQGSQGHSRPLQVILDEAEKCVLLCSNCHREHHDGMIGDAVFYSILANDLVRREKFRETMSREKQRSNKRNKCVYCDTEISPDAKTCVPCYNTRRTKICWPQAEELLKMITATSLVAVGKQLGVSGNAVKKRIRTHK